METNSNHPYHVFNEKLPPPHAFAPDPSATKLSPFEQQFRLDTGETNSTRRAEIEHRLCVKGQSKDTLLLKVDLSEWPEAWKPLAQVWVGIGAPGEFTREVNVNLTFSQRGAGVSAPLNNFISIDGLALLGANLPVKNGDITVEVENAGLPRDVNYILHAIVYVPRTGNPDKF